MLEGLLRTLLSACVYQWFCRWVCLCTLMNCAALTLSHPPQWITHDNQQMCWRRICNRPSTSSTIVDNPYYIAVSICRLKFRFSSSRFDHHIAHQHSNYEDLKRHYHLAQRCPWSQSCLLYAMTLATTPTIRRKSPRIMICTMEDDPIQLNRNNGFNPLIIYHILTEVS